MGSLKSLPTKWAGWAVIPFRVRKTVGGPNTVLQNEPGKEFAFGRRPGFPKRGKFRSRGVICKLGFIC
jgi:hypothetical protein